MNFTMHNTDSTPQMHQSIVKVSIGIPVYNGEKYIRKALDSVLKQNFTDFELIISDNASTDMTKDICEEYVVRDKRIRYIRQSTNIGVIRNFEAILTLARGDYLIWLAHDDYYESENHIQLLCEKLQAGYTLAFSNVNIIEVNSEDQIVRCVQNWFGNFRESKTRYEMNKFLVRKPSHQFYGMYRIDTLRKFFVYFVEDAYLSCFNEGRFLHKLFSCESCVFVDNIFLNVRMHEANVSRTIKAPLLLVDFMRYSFRIPMIYVSSPYSFLEKLSILLLIAIDHSRFLCRLFAATCKFYLLRLLQLH